VTEAAAVPARAYPCDLHLRPRTFTTIVHAEWIPHQM
jgi:hypothetical protein